MRTFEKEFAAKFFLRHHMSLILGATVSSGVLLNFALLRSGPVPILFRYPAAIVFGYFAFLGFMRLWLSYVSRAFESRALFIDAGEGNGGTPAAEANKKEKGSAWDWLDLDPFGIDEPAGCLIVLFVILLFGVSLYLIVDAPLILTEAAFQFLLAAGLIRSARIVDRPGWTGSVFRRTWIPVAVLLVFSIIFGLFAEVGCKHAITIREMIHKCG